MVYDTGHACTPYMCASGNSTQSFRLQYEQVHTL
jgi:hypothetical protein